MTHILQAHDLYGYAKDQKLLILLMLTGSDMIIMLNKQYVNRSWTLATVLLEAGKTLHLVLHQKITTHGVRPINFVLKNCWQFEHR